MIHLLLLPLLAAPLPQAATSTATQPAATAQSSAAAAPATNPTCSAKGFLGAASTPVDQHANRLTTMSCACQPAIVECGPQVLDSVTFLYQKPDYVCVYQCSVHQDCTQISCDCAESPVQVPGSYRGRVGPVNPPDQCPPPDPSICGF